MKSFKTTPKLNTNINYEKYQQSDIFIQKGLNKPEIKYTHKKILPRNTYNSSYNFLSWEEMSPHYDKSIKVKLNPNNISQILNSNHDLNKLPIKNQRKKNFYEKMNETEPEKVLNNSVSLNKNLNSRYQKETMFLGNYAGDEYKIRKNKSTLYEPFINNYEQKNPLKQKMDIIYKSSENIIGNYKPVINQRNKLDHSNTSIGYLKREFETNNDYDKKKINDPKKMKYFNIYGNKGIENANKELKPIMNLSRSTNNVYTPGINCTKNRINFLKSNIFYDEVIDKKNNEETKEENNNNKHNYKTIKVNRHINSRKKNKRSNSTSVLINKYYNRNNIINKSNITDFNNNSEINIDLTNIHNKNNSRKFIYKNNGEDNLPVKLDWKDPKTYLLFPQNKNRDILKKNSRQRKFKNLYNIDPALPKEKLGQEFKTDNRKEVEQITKNYYNNLNYAGMRKISDNISQYQIQENNKILNDHNYNVNNIKEKTYEIIYTKSRNNNYNITSNEELEKKFAKKGIHVYDIKDNNKPIINNNKNINVISFKIRENEKDEKIKEKIKEIQNEFIKDNLMMKAKIENKKENKKENNDIIPRDIYWNTPNSDLFTKNKKLINTNDGITHLKGKNEKNNNENKITRICVNLKYKNNNGYN